MGTISLPQTRKIDSSDRADYAKVRQFGLQILEGPGAGTIHTSKGDHAVVGKHESADFVMRDETVSRFHCEISLAPEQGPLLRDLGSRNGTVVDGVSVLAAHLRNGSVLHIGNTRLRFDLGQQSNTITLSGRDHFGLLVGRSFGMRAVFALLERTAALDATILIEGETGTGKEAVAESIHRESPRRDGPFVVVDCAAIPPNLLESELFGHEKGAYTGAVSDRQGAFEAASGGTIFLDEIGELSLELQPKLLRVLEQREVKRVGGSQFTPIDIRVIAATNRNLRSEVNARNFRPDLYYRLAVVEVRLPALCERKEDLPLLAHHLLREVGLSEETREHLLNREFLHALERHRWPGNVRELRNYLERCIALQEQAPLPQLVTSEPLEALIDPAQPFSRLKQAWSHIERSYLEQLFAKEGHNVSAAARTSGIDRVTLFRLLRRHGLR